LKTQLIHKDSHVNSLELSLTQKNDEIDELQESFNRSKQQQIDVYKKQIKDLQKDMHLKEAKMNEVQNELNIMKNLTNTFEKQKEEMLNKLQTQQISFSELLVKYEEQINFNKNNSVQDPTQADAHNLDRIRSLEDAIRESVNITAEREYAIAKQKTKNLKLETDNNKLKQELDLMKIRMSEQNTIHERLNANFLKREQQLESIEHEKVREMNDLLIAK
jgi:ELKS/RAB6-interacting/CAST family protein 1